MAIVYAGDADGRDIHCAIREFFIRAQNARTLSLPRAGVFAPAILDSPFLTGAFVLITVNWLFNLDYVFQVLRTTQHLPPHDPVAMVSSAFNVLGFGAIVTYVAFADSLRQSGGQLRA